MTDRAFEIYHARVLIADAQYRLRRPEGHQQRFGMSQLARAAAARRRAMAMPTEPVQAALL